MATSIMMLFQPIQCDLNLNNTNPVYEFNQFSGKQITVCDHVHGQLATRFISKISNSCSKGFNDIRVQKRLSTIPSDIQLVNAILYVSFDKLDNCILNFNTHLALSAVFIAIGASKVTVHSGCQNKMQGSFRELGHIVAVGHKPNLVKSFINEDAVVRQFLYHLGIVKNRVLKLLELAIIQNDQRLAICVENYIGIITLLIRKIESRFFIWHHFHLPS